MSALTIEHVDPSILIQHPDNPRRGNVELIAESLLVNGQYKPLVVSRTTSHVLAGNHTLQAIELIANGWRPTEWSTDAEEAAEERIEALADVAVTYVDVDEEGERRILAVDNRTSDLGTYDNAALVALLDSLGVLEGTGYTEDDLDTLRFLTGQEEPGLLSVGSTDAHYNESDEERERRAGAVGNYQPLSAQGLEEIIIVLPGSKKEQLITWLQMLRGRWGVEQTNGELIYAAVGKAVETQ
jgi:hypothetical protein